MVASQAGLGHRGRALNCVKVTAAARLHLGFLDLHGGLGRRFGSIGLAVDAFATTLTLRPAQAFSAHGLEAERSAALAQRIAGHLGLETRRRLEVMSAIPSHSGLGSGTQLALAIGAAFRRLADLPLDARADAQMLERGARSGVGAALFERGGIVVDAGRGASDRTPPVIANLAFPRDWRVILMLDPRETGVHGAEERRAFEQLPEFAENQAAEICRATLMQILPGVAESDLAAFGEGVARVQALVGDHFAPAQGGGRFTSKAVGRVAEQLKALGAQGVGQSSWGPTGFGFVADADQGEFIVRRLARDAEAGVEIKLAQVLDRGALIETL